MTLWNWTTLILSGTCLLLSINVYLLTCAVRRMKDILEARGLL